MCCYWFFALKERPSPKKRGGVWVRGGGWDDGEGGCQWLSESEGRVVGVEESGRTNVVDHFINYIGSLSTINLQGMHLVTMSALEPLPSTYSFKFSLS